MTLLSFPLVAVLLCSYWAAADLKDSMTASGFIGLQVHGVGKRTEPLQVRWRNLRLEDLSKK